MRKQMLKQIFFIGVLVGCLGSVSAQTEKLTLETASEKLLQKNLALEAARLEVTAAQQARVYARLRPRPTLNVSAENLRLSGPTSFGQLYETSAVVTQPIPLGGQTKNRLELAERTISLAEARLDSVLRVRLAEMRRVYYEALLAQTRVRIEEENFKNFEELIRYSEVRLKEGDVAPAEVLKFRLERTKYVSAVANARLNLRQTKIRLFELLGETDFIAIERIELDQRFAFQDFNLNLTSLKENALANRPEIKVAEAELARAQAVFRLERSRAKGEIEPYAGYRRVGPDNTVLAGVSIPLPFGNRNQATIAQAEVDQKIAATALQQIKNRTLAEVEATFSALETAREQIKAFDSGLLGQADDLLQVAILSYREGAADQISLLEAQRARTDVQTNYYQNLLSYYINLFELELLTGTEFKT